MFAKFLVSATKLRACFKPWGVGFAVCLLLGSVGRSDSPAGGTHGPATPVLREIQDEQFRTAIFSLDLARGSDLAVAALSNATVRVWHLDTGEVVHEFALGEQRPTAQQEQGQHEVLRARFAPDGKTLAISYRSCIYLYNAGTWRGRKSLGVEEEGLPPARGKPRPWWAGDGRMRVTDFAFTPDGEHIVAAYCRDGCEIAIEYGWLFANPTGNDPIRLWDARTGELVWERMSDPNQVVERISLSPDGKLFATVSEMLPGEYRVIQLYDLAAGRPLYALPKFRSNLPPANVLFTPDGQQFVTASRTDWRPGERSQRAYCMRTHLGLYETATGKPIAQILNQYGAVDMAAMSPDGRWLAAATCGTPGFQLWDLRTLQPVARTHSKGKGWPRHSDDIFEFTPGGRKLVVADSIRGLLAVFQLEF